MYLQPFANYNLPDGLAVGSQMEISTNWDADSEKTTAFLYFSVSKVSPAQSTKSGIWSAMSLCTVVTRGYLDEEPMSASTIAVKPELPRGGGTGGRPS